jgi:UDP:flavonoid glycosyltransferase YjiC (YdhE family)
MQGITENKAGICLRASKLNKSLVKSALGRLLHDKTYSLQAKKLSNRFLEYDALNKFRNILETHLSAKNQINPL